MPTPVKAAALERGLTVYEPTKLKPFADDLRALAPEIFAVASYGRILPQIVLDVPSSGLAFNVHPSLLPLYRGATPLQTAIRDGRTETGVTIIAMDAGMDTGDILVQERTPLGARETYGELHDRLALLGADLLVRAIDAYANGALVRVPQTGEASVTRPIGKDDLRIEWNAAPERIVDLVRSLAPAPGARAEIDGEPVKVLDARVARDGESGVTADDGVVMNGVVLVRVVPPNRSAMSGGAFARAKAAV
jgi:methionyl-tRNA formyltransferase